MNKSLLKIIFTSVFSFLISPLFSQYCLSSFTTGCNDGDMINQFYTTGGVTNISNLNSGCNGVLPNVTTYFPNLSCSQVQGQNIAVNVQSGTATWTQGFRIWVDWDNDFAFSATESVWASAAASTALQTGTFTIPATATPGLKRMRVMCRFATVPAATDACGGSFSYGEVEDYNLVVISNINCSTPVIAGTATASPNPVCPGQPITMSLTGNTNANGISYQWWRASSCNGPWVPLPSSNSNPYSYTPPSSTTGATYYFKCHITCLNSGAVDSSTCVGPIVVQPWSPTSPCYGPSSSTLTNNINILNVTLGSLNNSTTCNTPLVGSQGVATGSANQFADFTGVGGVPPPTIFKVLPTPFSFTNGGCTGTNTSNLAVYIDYNHNAVFEDPAELAFSNGATAITAASTLTGNVTVPSTALTGITRMRVINKYTTGGAITPSSTYFYGETEDYLVDILAQAPVDPAVISITGPTGNCFSANENFVVQVTNYGSQTINLFNTPLKVYLIQNGVVIDSVLLNGVGQTLLPSGGNSINANFNNINLYPGGTYSINTSLAFTNTTVNNAYLHNDSLSIAPSYLNLRPTPGPDYTLCQYSSIPFGQGLTASGCATPVNDSIVIPFTLNTPLPNPTSNSPNGAMSFATGLVPTLSLPTSGVTVTGAVEQVTNLSTALGGWANEARFPIFSGPMTVPPNIANALYASAVGNTATGSSCFQWNNYPSLTSTNSATNLTNLWNYIINPLNAGNTLSMGYHSTWSGNATSKGFNINACASTTIAVLKIYYTYVPASFEWYAVPTGGTILSTSVPFDPIGVPGSGVPNSNTTGIYPFYVSCQGSSDCRAEVDLIIPAAPITIQDTLTHCEFPSGSNGALFNLTTVIPSVGPQSVIDTNVQVTFYQDQGLFSPVTPDTAYLTSSNFVYTKVQDTLNGCFTSDSLYLSVFSTPDFGSAFLNGNAYAPSYRCGFINYGAIAYRQRYLIL
ncbi:MAG: GEVED domain-containing protein [Chitinophagaceae bacterium]